MMSKNGGLNCAKDLGNTKNVLFKAPHHEVKIVAKKANQCFLVQNSGAPWLKWGDNSVLEPIMSDFSCGVP